MAVSANIIPFPNRHRPAGDNLERLSRAMDALVGAMETQQKVARDYRTVVQELNNAVQDLGSSFQRYGGALSTLDAGFLVVRTEANRLVETMGRACAA